MYRSLHRIIHRWHQVGEHLFPGNRLRWSEHLRGKLPRWRHHHRLLESRSRDLRPPTTNRPRMVCSFFSLTVGVWAPYMRALLGSGALVPQPALITCVRAGAGVSRCVTPILANARHNFASAPHFSVRTTDLILNPDCKQCWQLPVRPLHLV